MIIDILKFAVKTAAVGAFWVFVLSIRVEDKALFHHATEVLVQNDVVYAVDTELTDLWNRLSRTAETTIAKAAQDGAEKI